MKLKYFQIPFLVLLFFSLKVRAQVYDFNLNCKNAYMKACDLRFEEARALINNEKKQNPKNLIPLYVENTIDFLTVFIGEQNEDFSKLEPNKKLRLLQLEKGDPNSPWHLFIKGEIYLQWAFARVKFQEYLSAANEIRLAYRCLDENNIKYPQFYPNKKGLGLLHSLIGTIPDSYKWAASIVGLSGNLDQGVLELSNVLFQTAKYQEYNQFETECAFFLSFIHLNLLNDEAKLIHLDNWFSRYKLSNSPLLTYAKVSICMKLGKNDMASSILEKYNPDKTVYPFWYLEYLKGETKLRKLDPECKVHFDAFLKNFKGRNFIKAAIQKKAWYSVIQNDPVNYFKIISAISNAGFLIADEDKMAQKELETKLFPNTYLLKARLLCDGGYYQKALAQLQEKKPSEFVVTSRDLTEYYYRLGRIYQFLERNDDAIKYFGMTYNSAWNQKWYFAANSLLQMALIYEKTKDYKNARIYFEKAIALKNHEYENGIELKAKAGLQRIK